MIIQRTFLSLCILFCYLAINFPCVAHPIELSTASIEANHALSVENLNDKIATLTARSDLDESVKNKLLGFYRSANENLRNDQWFQFLAQSYQESIDQASKRSKILQEKIASFQTQTSNKHESFESNSTEQLEQRLILEQTHLNDLNTQLAKFENELSIQDARLSEIRQETESAKQLLEDSDKNSEIFKLFAESEQEREARQVQLKTLQSKLTSQLKMLGLETISHPNRVESLKNEIQLCLLKKQALLPIISEIQHHLAQRQQQDAKNLKDKLLQIERNNAHKHPLIQAVAKQNIQYSLDLQAISRNMERNSVERDRLESQSLEVETDFKSAEKKISLAGLSPELGKILREQRYSLPTAEQFAPQTRYLQTETKLTSLAEFKIEARAKELVDVESELQRLLNTLPPEKSPAIEPLKLELRDLLNEQKELLSKLSKAYTSYLRGLSEYDFAKQQLLSQATKYALFLDERLLWVPSSEPISKTYFVNLYAAGKWLLTLAHWKRAAIDLLYSIQRQFFLLLLCFFTLSLLHHYKAKFQQQLVDINTKVGGLYSDKFYFTLSAMTYTVMLVLRLPLGVFFLSYFLETANQPHEFTLAIAKGLQNTTIPLFFLNLFYTLLAPNNLVEKHFNWQRKTMRLLYRQIHWVRKIVIPVFFLMHLANASKNTLYSDSLGRLSLIIIMLCMMRVLMKLLHPTLGIWHCSLKENLEHWLIRLRYVWYACAILVPLTVIGFALAGYYLSALELEQKLIISLRLCFFITLVHELVLRWLTLVNRQLALTNARQKRKAAQANAQQTATGETEPVELQLLDIPKINQQTKKLFNLGIGIALFTGQWIIWKNILPAFSFLDQVVLWQHLEKVDNQEILQAITLINLLLAMVYAAVTFIAVTNFAGLLEVLILRRFSFDLGTRYAITQLSYYILISIGMLCVVSELGGSWAQVQWLVAALSVGLGFGLQEIFANLVSGIILLFERPIRIGDTVTIGDTTGKVSQIEMRATRIVDWDQKELIVPNKNFITDKLVNWALSSQITRLVIPIGIAYGTDVEFAHQVITETVCNTPLVLAEPKPDIYFLGFGDSALEFSIRVHVGILDHRLPVTHALHTRLYQALAEHNIEIPLPQREVHLRSKSF